MKSRRIQDRCEWVQRPEYTRLRCIVSNNSEPALQDPATNLKPLSGGWVDVCWTHGLRLQKSRVRRGYHTFPGFLFGPNVPSFKIYHTTRFCEASISYKLLVQPRTACFPKYRIDCAKQSNALGCSFQTCKPSIPPMRADFAKY
jgi:hypothetical protein